VPSSATHLDVVHTLYSDHHSWLRNWLSRKLGSSAHAADLAQDTFVRILSAAPESTSAVREPRSYLATIANRVVIDHLRRRKLERAYLEALSSLPEAQAPSPEAQELVMETLCQIDAMLHGLGARPRQAFLWSQLEGASYADIAERLEVSVSSVKKYVARATERCLLYTLELE